MSKAKVRIQYGRVWLEVDADGVKDAIKALSEYGEVFAEVACGHCGHGELRYEHRQDTEGHDYYSVKCVGCGACLDFGQHKVGGTLFAKRKDSEGNYDREHGGWYHWKDRSPQQGGGDDQGRF